MNTKYQEDQRNKQLLLLYNRKPHAELFENAEYYGYWWDFGSWKHYPHILQHKCSINNMYKPIRQDALDYFDRNDVTWWRQDEDRYFPSGHMLSSQIHCLNHLFAIRTDKDAVLAIIKALCPDVKDILPSPIDCHIGIIDGKPRHRVSYITFEFTCANQLLLNETGNRRGKKCTSIDAFVYAIDKKKRRILIPIEWKYTEAYDKSPKKKAHKSSIERYVDLANLDSSNLKEWISDYEWDPLYEFARQELLMEQIIRNSPECGFGNKQKPLLADDFIHIIVRPDENTEIANDIAAFKNTIVDSSKLIEIDPQQLLAPLKGCEQYSDLLDYLDRRYWTCKIG